MQNNPCVTIILPTFNRAHLIAETLDSICFQTYSNWECLIIDDGSVDKTKDVIDKYLKKDERFFYYLRTEDYKKGAAGARNYGLDLACQRNAQIIQFFDDDDIMYPQKLELQLKPFLENPDLDFTVCKFDKLVQMKNGDSKVQRPSYNLHHEHVGDAILSGNLKMNTLSSMWNMNVLKEFRFNEDLDHAEEWELFTRIGYHHPNNYGIVDEYLYSYRKHPNTLTMGEDPDYAKRKTSGVIRMILCDYLSRKQLHTNASIIYFGKTFLIYYYNPSYVEILTEYIKENQGFSWRLRLFLQSGLQIAKSNRQIISKLSTWV